MKDYLVIVAYRLGATFSLPLTMLWNLRLLVWLQYGHVKAEVVLIFHRIILNSFWRER